MAQRCDNCRFSLAYEPPTGEPPPEPEPIKGWRKLFSPTWVQPEAGHLARYDWFQQLAASNFVLCRRFPESADKDKSDWCGEYEAGT